MYRYNPPYPDKISLSVHFSPLPLAMRLPFAVS
jgi:hypothetical protein